MAAEDWYVIAGITLGLCFVLFMLLDSYHLRRKEPEPLPREQLKRGFIPGASAADPGMLILAVASVYVGYTEWVTPAQPPFTGRYAWLSAALYQAFGPRGAPVLFWVFAAIVFVAVIARRLRK